MERRNQTAVNVHRKPSASSTLNRKYVKRPIKNTDGMISHHRHAMSAMKAPAATAGAQDSSQAYQVQAHPAQVAARAKMQARMQTPAPAPKISAKELKDQAIKRALSAANNAGTMASQIKKTEKTQKTGKLHFGISRIILALSCAAATVFAIAYFVSLNMPDLSLKVAAMQTGINASYPSYIPRDYKLSSISSEEGKISLHFNNSSTAESFSLVEEKSSWDSVALLSNYVKNTFGDNYSVIREQGLTIYVSGSDAAWVNGGIVYKLNAKAGLLTNKQIRSIAVSL